MAGSSASFGFSRQRVRMEDRSAARHPDRTSTPRRRCASLNWTFPDDHPSKRSEADGSPNCDDLPPARQRRGFGCALTGHLARDEHGSPAFFRHRCRTAPSHSPVPSSPIPPEGAWLTGWPQSGRPTESADPFEDRSEESSGHGDFRQLERRVLRVPGDLGTDLDELLLQRRQRPLPHAALFDRRSHHTSFPPEQDFQGRPGALR